jgi:hypothetical protein
MPRISAVARAVATPPSVATRVVATAPAPATAVEDEVTVSLEAAPLEQPPAGTWPDESAEASFLGEARERGESLPAKPVEATEPAEDLDPKAMPALDELVQRIPPEVRETLEDLFRARFTTVKRIPKRALKIQAG